MKEKNINYKKLIISILVVFLVYISMAMENITSRFNIIILPICVLLVMFLYKMKFDKKYKKMSIIISIIYSLFYVIGSTTQGIIFSNTTSLFRELLSIHTICKILISFPISYILLMNIFSILEKVKIEGTRNKNRKRYFLCAILMFCLWIPYFLIFIPGFLSPDSIDQITQIINSGFTNHHPIFHTFFELIPYKIGMSLSNSSMVATSFVTITQMIIMSLIFSYLIHFLYKRNVNKVILVMVFLYYSILPMNALYSMILWKDIIFAGLIIILSIQLIYLIEEKIFTISKMFKFGLICLITMLFRHNALYMMALLVVVLLIAYRSKWKYILTTFLLVFSCYYVINIPIFNYFNIKRSSSAEYIAIPLQQVGRMTYKNLKFSNESKETLDKLLPYEKMKKLYNPVSVNPLKFDNDFDEEYFNKNKGKILKAYLDVVFDHPTTAVEAYFVSTLGYWYPNVDEWTVPSEVTQNSYGIERKSILSKSLSDKLLDLLTSKRIPLYNLIWSIGLYVWIIIFAICYIIHKKEYKKLIVYVPLIGIWLSLMVAAPVYAEYRYMYPFVTTLPLMLLLPFIKLKKNNQ